MAATEFARFSSLPSELRDQIWRYALPLEDPPVLFFFTKYCWHLRLIPVHDESGKRLVRMERCFELSHDQLYWVHIDLPLVFVNRQARIVALDWARERNIQLQQDKGHSILVRSFRTGCLEAMPSRDSLYISQDMWELFRKDYANSDAFFNAEFFTRETLESPDIQIAVPESVLKTSAPTLIGVLLWFENIKVVQFVVDAPPDLRPRETDTRVQQHWQFEKINGGTFHYSHSRPSFEPEDWDNYDLSLRRRMKNFRKNLRKTSLEQLEIQFVTAVKA